MKITKIINKVEWHSFGDKYTPSDKYRKIRAEKYAQILKFFEEIGAGADECLNDTRLIVKLIKSNCKLETGYEISY